MKLIKVGSVNTHKTEVRFSCKTLGKNTNNVIFFIVYTDKQRFVFNNLISLKKIVCLLLVIKQLLTNRN